MIAPRVAKVGVEKFAIVSVDPAKKRSWWMMADVDTRLLHPFATKQYRLPADPGAKTDAHDLAAAHRAATQGFGLTEQDLEEPNVSLSAAGGLARHRRDLVEKATALQCQIREHLDVAMPGYAACFSNFWNSSVALCLARATGTPNKLLVQGRLGLTQILKREKRVFQSPTLDPPRRTGLGATSGRARRRCGVAAAGLDGTRRVAATVGASDRAAGGRCGRNPRENTRFVAVAAARHQRGFGGRPGGRDGADCTRR